MFSICVYLEQGLEFCMMVVVAELFHVKKKKKLSTGFSVYVYLQQGVDFCIMVAVTR